MFGSSSEVRTEEELGKKINKVRQKFLLKEI